MRLDSSKRTSMMLYAKSEYERHNLSSANLSTIIVARLAAC